MSLEVVAVIVCPLVLGWGFLALIAPGRRPGLERIAWSYMLGALLVAILVGLWIVTGAPPVGWLGIALPLVCGALLLGARLLLRRSGEPARPLRQREGRGLLERAAFWIALAAVLGVLVDRIAVFNLTPVVWGDEAFIWATRAKVLYETWAGSDMSLETASVSPLFHHADYPLFNPLLQVWVFLISGRLTDVLNRLPFQAAFIAVVLVSASRLRRALRPGAAASLLLLWLPGSWLAVTWFGATADVLVAGGFLLAIESWRDFVEDRQAASWRLFACASAILVWAKHEGTMLMLCVVLGSAVSVVRDRSLRRSIGALGWDRAWLLLPVALVVATWVVNGLAGYENDLISANPGRRAIWQTLFPLLGERAWPVTRHIWTNVILAPHVSRLLWLPFLAVIVLAPRSAWAARHGPATLAILAGAVGYWLVFVGTFRDLDWHLKYAADRVFFHLWPALLVWTAHMTAELFPRAREVESNHAPIKS